MNLFFNFFSNSNSNLVSFSFISINKLENRFSPAHSNMIKVQFIKKCPHILKSINGAITQCARWVNSRNYISSDNIYNDIINNKNHSIIKSNKTL